MDNNILININKKTNILSLVFHFLFIAVFAFSPLVIPVAFAANTIIGVTPQSGTYTVGTPVNLDLVIDGHGDTFNAAQATLTLSQNLAVTDMTLGDCNFSFMKTPTAANPAFIGVLLGSSSQKCTVYTLTVTPSSTGTGTITLSDASVKEYKTAHDILATLQNGNYTLSPSSDVPSEISISPTSTTSPTAPVNEPNLSQEVTDSSPYSLTIKAVNADNTPLAGATVILDGQQVTQPVETNNTSNTPLSDTPQITQPAQTENNITPVLQTATTNASGIAEFSGVVKGIHTIVVQHNNKQFAKTVFNVNGANHAMTLGIKSQKQPLDLTIIILGAILVIIEVLIFFLIRKTSAIEIFLGRKKTAKDSPPTTVLP